MPKRKICVITGTRAEYGHLYWLMKEIKRDYGLKLQTIVTGTHLSPKFGSTSKVIEKDGFKINGKVNILSFSDTEMAINKSISRGISKFADIFIKLKPDIIVILGDRYEIFSAAVAAYVLKIPIAHIHGGELTQGVIDEAFRHCITKMAYVHFSATRVYAERIIRMGENPNRVFTFGAPGLDNIKRCVLLSKKELERSLGFRIDNPTALITYHPVTLERNTSEKQTDELFRALGHFDMKIVFTMPNADADYKIIFNKIKQYVNKNKDNAKVFVSLGQVRYLSLLKYADLMIGNSSSGLIEAPSFKLPVVNIGDRQKGRIRAKNVIDCGYATLEIKKSIAKALTLEFKNSLKELKNPYRDGNAAVRIKNKLKKINLDEKLLKKEFFDG